jgi:arsenate reductase
MTAEATPAPAPVRRRVLFVCIGNSCRSQLAEGFARKLAPDVIAPASAGLSPLGRIADSTRAIANEFGISLDGQSSKGFDAADLQAADLVVNLTGIPSRGLFATEKPVITWDVEDPYGEELAVYRRVAAEIEGRIRELAGELRAGNAVGK